MMKTGTMTQIMITSTPSATDGSYFHDAWISAGQAVADTIERLERRQRLIGYVRDVRALLAETGVYTHGPKPQAYRDRWSCLCRQLCENGKPLLTDISYGKPLPAELL